MIKEYLAWLNRNELIGHVNYNNETEYFNKFVESHYNDKPMSYIIKDILNELYTVGSMASQTNLLLKKIHQPESFGEEITKFLQGLSYGQEDEKSNKRHTKSRVNAKESGEKKRKASEPRSKSSRSRD